METLNLSEPSRRSDGRLKSLFWPSIQSAADVDYLGAQGLGVCTFVAILSAVFLIAQSLPVTAFATFAFYYVGGIGVREGSAFAAALVFAMSALELLVGGFGIARIIFTALFLSNLRAAWIAPAGSQTPTRPYGHHA